MSLNMPVLPLLKISVPPLPERPTFTFVPDKLDPLPLTETVPSPEVPMLTVVPATVPPASTLSVLPPLKASVEFP
jgi:hypothetical protein